MRSRLPLRTRPESCLSDLALDQLRVGELSERQEALARRHLLECSRCEARRAQLASEAANELPPLLLPRADGAEPCADGVEPRADGVEPRADDVEPHADGVEPRAKGGVEPRADGGIEPRTHGVEPHAPADPASGRRTRWVAPLTMMAAAALLVLVWPRSGPQREEDPAPTRDDGGKADAAPARPGTQAKGAGPRLKIYVRRGTAVVEADALDHWRPGDVLGFAYSSVQPRYLAVLGRDATGSVSVYYPRGPTAARAEPGQDVAFGDGIELDDTLGEEVVYGVFCAHAVEVARLRAALARMRGEPVLPAGCELVTVRADKAAR